MEGYTNDARLQDLKKRIAIAWRTMDPIIKAKMVHLNTDSFLNLDHARSIAYKFENIIWVQSRQFPEDLNSFTCIDFQGNKTWSEGQKSHDKFAHKVTLDEVTTSTVQNVDEPIEKKLMRRNGEAMLYASEGKNEFWHVNNFTASADLILTAQKINGLEVIIPIHKLILSENVALFKRMFGDVWTNQNPRSNEQLSSSTSEFLSKFSAEAQFYYFKSVYPQSQINIPTCNMLEVFMLADFLNDSAFTNYLTPGIENMVNLHNFRSFWETGSESVRELCYRKLMKYTTINSGSNHDLKQVQEEMHVLLNDLFENLDLESLKYFIERSMCLRRHVEIGNDVYTLGYPVMIYYLSLKIENAAETVDGLIDFIKSLNLEKASICENIGIFTYIDWINDNDLEMNSIERCQIKLFRSVQRHSRKFNCGFDLSSIAEAIFQDPLKL